MGRAYTLVGNPVRAAHVGEIYIDVGTLAAYHAAQDFLRRTSAQPIREAA